MEAWMVREERYEETMNQVVWPYLKERERELTMKDPQGNALHVCNYHADQPKEMVLISHGFTETAHKYGEVIYYFLMNGYEVYILEHCGHGRSYRLVEDPCLVHVDSYKRYIRDVLRVASAARKEHPELSLTLYGHSMGGGIAAGAAGEQPELFDRVILSSPMIRPLTGSIPWPLAKVIAAAACALGKEKDYVFGNGPYQGLEPFETSASTSRARFDYYQKYRFGEPLAQMSGPSYSWIREAIRLNHELLTKTVKNLHMPLLLFQAESDQSVSNEEQDRFLRLIRKNGGTNARKIKILGAKHEIFNAPDEVVERYWKHIFRDWNLDA